MSGWIPRLDLVVHAAKAPQSEDQTGALADGNGAAWSEEVANAFFDQLSTAYDEAKRAKNYGPFDTNFDDFLVPYLQGKLLTAQKTIYTLHTFFKYAKKIFIANKSLQLTADEKKILYPLFKMSTLYTTDTAGFGGYTKDALLKERTRFMDAIGVVASWIVGTYADTNTQNDFEEKTGIRLKSGRVLYEFNQQKGSPDANAYGRGLYGR